MYLSNNGGKESQMKKSAWIIALIAICLWTGFGAFAAGKIPSQVSLTVGRSEALIDNQKVTLDAVP